MDGTRVLTDPLLTDRLGPLRRRPPLGRDLSPITPDVVLISHAHHDHLHLPSLRRLGGRPPIVVPIGLGTLLARHRYEAIEVAPGDVVTIGAVRITATPALHHGGRGPLLRAHAAVGYRMDATTRVYFAGDTDLFPQMADLAGTIDVALLPVWGWGPRLGPGHLDPRRAAEAARRIGPRVAIPIHWGTFYPLGLSRLWPGPLERPPLDFVEEMRRVAPACAVRVLAPGDALALT